MEDETLYAGGVRHFLLFTLSFATHVTDHYLQQQRMHQQKEKMRRTTRGRFVRVEGDAPHKRRAAVD